MGNRSPTVPVITLAGAVINKMGVLSHVLVGVLLLHCSVNVNSFEFDHAFRSDASNARLAEYQENLMKKIGLAMGEEEEESRPLTSQYLQRRSGKPDPEDQEAVESEESEKRRQFFDSKKNIKEGLSNVTMTERKTVSRRTGEASRRKEEASRRSDEAPRRKKEVPRRKQEASSKRKHTSSRRTDDIDVSSIPAEHRRGSGRPSVLGQAALNARNLVMRASSNAFQPATIATYLTQMWLANIFQTVGWAIVGGLYNVNSGRSFPAFQRSQERVRDSESVLSGMDSKTVAGILRGLAEAADNWEEREEL